MKAHKKLLSALMAIAVVLSFVGIYLFVNDYSQEETSTKMVSGKLISIHKKPNHAEDGEYKITIEDDDGAKYLIDAGNYLNTPLTSAHNGEKCIHIKDPPNYPSGEIRAEFVLPKDDHNPGETNYTTCYDEDLTGFYFKWV